LIDGYLEHLPPGYATNTQKKYPLIVYLHGTGERGNGSTDLYKIARVGDPSRRVEENGSLCFTVNGVQECFIVISPQLNKGSNWTAASQEKFWKYILEQSGYRIDPDRVYLTGHSLGGNGVWEAAYSDFNSPNVFAAIAPLSYWTNTSKVCNVADRKIPVWAFWGEKDGQFINQSKAAISILKNCPRDPAVEIKSTEIPGAGHSITGPTYRVDHVTYNPNLFEWLLSKKRNSGTSPLTVPNSPGQVQANTQSSSSIKITWNDNSSNEDGFSIERSASPGGSFASIATVGANNASFVDTGLTQSSTYYYRVRAYNIAGKSSYTSPANATTSEASSASGTYINWTNINGAVQNGHDLEKTASYGWGNSGAQSTQAIDPNLDGWIEMVIEDVLKTDLVFGLSDANINDNIASTDFGFELSKYNNAFWKREASDREYLGTFQEGDILRIERSGSTIIYNKNGQSISTTHVTSTPLLIADVAFLNPGATVFSGKISAVSSTNQGVGYITWTNINGAVQNGHDLEKTASFGWGNSGAESSQVIPSNSDGWIEMVIEDALKTDLVFGLSYANINDNLASTDFGYELSKYNNAFWKRETSDREYLGTFKEGDVLRIERLGSTIIYKKNGQSISTTTVMSTPSLVADVAFLNTGSTVFKGKISTSSTPTPPNPTFIVWTNIHGAAQNASNLIKTEAYGWGNCGAESSQTIAANSDGWIEMLIADVQKANLTFGLSSSNVDDRPETVNYGFEVSENNLAYWKRENNTRTYLGTFTEGDIFRIERQGNAIVFKRNGTLVASTAVASTPELIADVSLIYTDDTIFQGRIFSAGAAGSGARTISSPDSSAPLADQAITVQQLLSEKPKVLAYPNPVGDQGLLNIELVGYDLKNGGVFSLFDLSGKLMLEQKIDNASTEIGLQNLPQSVYIYHLILDGSKIKSGRIIR
jgi:hypothetical protein